MAYLSFNVSRLYQMDFHFSAANESIPGRT